MNIQIRTAVQQFFSPENPSRPFGAQESYYARSSHADFHVRGRVWGFSSGLDYRDRPLNPLFKEAGQGDGGEPKTCELCAEIEKFFIIGYMASAVHDEMNFDKEPDRWFHRPFPGAHTTFDDLWEDDDRVDRGTFLTLEDFKNDGAIAKSFCMFNSVKESKGATSEEAHGKELVALHAVLLEAMGTIRARAMTLLESIPDQVDVSTTS